MKKIISYFVRGLLFIVPIAITLYVVFITFTTIDGFFKLPIPGAGFVLTLLFIMVVGFLTSNIFTKKMTELIDNLLNSLPVVKLIYNSLKDLMGAFVGDKKSFNQPVLVEVASNGIKVGGFLTEKDLKKLGIIDHVAVYLPQSYNFAGNVIFVPSSLVHPVNIDSASMMAFIVSGGVAGKKGSLEG